MVCSSFRGEFVQVLGFAVHPFQQCYSWGGGENRETQQVSTERKLGSR
jgi:hypothetical protein